MILFSLLSNLLQSPFKIITKTVVRHKISSFCKKKKYHTQHHKQQRNPKCTHGNRNSYWNADIRKNVFFDVVSYSLYHITDIALGTRYIISKCCSISQAMKNKEKNRKNKRQKECKINNWRNYISVYRNTYIEKATQNFDQSLTLWLKRNNFNKCTNSSTHLF